MMVAITRVRGGIFGRRLPRLGGQNCTPVNNPDFDGYNDIMGRVNAASAGQDVEGFHKAIARNVDSAYRAGKALRWLHFGGELLTAKVDRNGVSVSPIYLFKGHHPLNVLSWEIREEMAERIALATLANLDGAAIGKLPKAEGASSFLPM